MNRYCKDEFDWLMKDKCFSSLKDIIDFIDSG